MRRRRRILALPCDPKPVVHPHWGDAYQEHRMLLYFGVRGTSEAYAGFGVYQPLGALGGVSVELSWTRHACLTDDAWNGTPRVALDAKAPASALARRILAAIERGDYTRSCTFDVDGLLRDLKAIRVWGRCPGMGMVLIDVAQADDEQADALARRWEAAERAKYSRGITFTASTPVEQLERDIEAAERAHVAAKLAARGAQADDK